MVILLGFVKDITFWCSEKVSQRYGLGIYRMIRARLVSVV